MVDLFLSFIERTAWTVLNLRKIKNVSRENLLYRDHCMKTESLVQIKNIIGNCVLL